MKNFAKVTLATCIGFCGIGAFSQTENVQAAGLDITSQDSINANTSNVITKQSIISEPKTIKHHHVKYEKVNY